VPLVSNERPVQGICKAVSPVCENVKLDAVNRCGFHSEPLAAMVAVTFVPELVMLKEFLPAFRKLPRFTLFQVLAMCGAMNPYLHYTVTIVLPDIILAAWVTLQCALSRRPIPARTPRNALRSRRTSIFGILKPSFSNLISISVRLTSVNTCRFACAK